MLINNFYGTMERGLLLIFEGCDRVGKTTQAKKLVEWMNANGNKTKFRHFPDRSTESGSQIDAYLNNKCQLSDEEIHKLFSRNRWEVKPIIENELSSGLNLIVDRYAYSGVAFSSAKGLDLTWCKSTDAGLTLPDAVFYFDLNPELATARGGYGDERYEAIEFQKKVYSMYQKLKEDSWIIVDASKPIDEIFDNLKKHVTSISVNSTNTNFSSLWSDLVSS